MIRAAVARALRDMDIIFTTWLRQYLGAENVRKDFQGALLVSSIETPNCLIPISENCLIQHKIVKNLNVLSC